MQFTSLWERMKPEVKTTLTKNTEPYPYTYQEIKEELEKKLWVGDIRFGTVATIISFAGIAPGPYRYDEFSDLFESIQS